MTCEDMLAQIRAWLAQEALTAEEYVSLADLTISFCHNCTERWSADILETIEAVLALGPRYTQAGDYRRPMDVIEAFTAAPGRR